MELHTAKITSKSVEQSGLPTDYAKAIAEYIWNGFDAKATEVNLYVQANELGHIKEFSISDNGTGINRSTIGDTFGNFLDSQKTNTFNQEGFVKGKKGKGRFSFKLFANKATWKTVCKENNNFLSYDIHIESSKLQNFTTSESTITNTGKTGTTVSFETTYRLTSDLIETESFYDFLACEFGWFLYLNSNYSLKVNDYVIDYNSIIDKTETFEPKIGENNFKISFIRWKKNIGDKYYYYFLDGSKKEKEKKHTSFNNKTEDFHHSVYIESSYFESFKFSNAKGDTLDFNLKDQNDKIFKRLLSFLKEKLSVEEKVFIKEFKANQLIDKFHKQLVFPNFRSNAYDELRKEDLERVVKEIYCAQPKIFRGLKVPQSKTIVGFLNLLLGSEKRDEILGVLAGIVNLTEEEKNDLSKILNKTKLTSEEV